MFGAIALFPGPPGLCREDLVTPFAITIINTDICADMHLAEYVYDQLDDCACMPIQSVDPGYRLYRAF